jgi:hypothetical protein
MKCTRSYQFFTDHLELCQESTSEMLKMFGDCGWRVEIVGQVSLLSSTCGVF